MHLNLWNSFDHFYILNLSKEWFVTNGRDLVFIKRLIVEKTIRIYNYCKILKLNSNTIATNAQTDIFIILQI